MQWVFFRISFISPLPTECGLDLLRYIAIFPISCMHAMYVTHAFLDPRVSKKGKRNGDSRSSSSLDLFPLPFFSPFFIVKTKPPLLSTTLSYQNAHTPPLFRNFQTTFSVFPMWFFSLSLSPLEKKFFKKRGEGLVGFYRNRNGAFYKA